MDGPHHVGLDALPPSLSPRNYLYLNEQKATVTCNRSNHSKRQWPEQQPGSSKAEGDTQIVGAGGMEGWMNDKRRTDGLYMPPYPTIILDTSSDVTSPSSLAWHSPDP